MSTSRARVTFAIPAGAGTYDTTTVIDLTRGPRGNAPGGLSDLSVLVESLPAGASISLDLLKVGLDPATAGNWYLDVQSFTATGLQLMVVLAGWYGARLRGKSGGTAGNAIVSASWD
jgi:hypothetical protein